MKSRILNHKLQIISDIQISNVCNFKFGIYLGFVFCCLVLFLVAPLGANAGTIIRAPAYLGLNAGLLGYWTFDGTDIYGTSARDKSGNGNHGTITGAIKGAGKLGQALSFDGVDDVVTMSNGNSVKGLSQVTISVWVYLRSTSAAQSIYQEVINADGSNRLSLAVQPGGQLEFGGRAPDASSFADWAYSNSVLNKNIWYHVVAVYDSVSDVHYIYINGVDRSMSNSVVTVTFDNTNPSVVPRSGLKQGPGQPVNGLIDDLRIYNRALSDFEVGRLYKIGSGSKFNNASGGDSLDKGLVGHWTFDGADIYGTSARDRSGNGNHGTISGATRAAGKLGQALSFDGSNDFVYVDDPGTSSLDITGKLTLSAWIYKYDTITNGWADIVTKASSVCNPNNYWMQIIDRSGIEYLDFAVRDSSQNGELRSTSPITLNKWMHVVVTYDDDANDIKFYYDGVHQTGEVVVFSPNPETLSMVANDSDLRIGWTWDSGSTQPFPGLIDDVRLYNRALSADEIKRLYNQTQSKFNSSTTGTSINKGLVGHWTFDGADIYGTSARDKSGSGNHGTITGATKTAGKIGQGLNFDGVDDYVSTSDISSVEGLTNLSISAWIKPNAWNLNDFVVEKGNTFVLGSHTSIGSYGGFMIREAGTANWKKAALTASPSLRVWHHITGVYNGQNILIYLDGALITTGDAYTGVIRNENDILNIGGRDTTYPFDGLVDDVRIYNRALSADEVKILYNMGR